MVTRLTEGIRRADIEASARQVYAEFGVTGLTFRNVARNCQHSTSEATVRRYFHRLDDLFSVAGIDKSDKTD